MASAALPDTATADDTGRPEFYDFDLFASRLGDGSTGAHALADMPLTELGFTVFDTETMGMDPGNGDGDEIIQIGATRIVVGKLRY